jgi:peptide/nickel transport system permease protein
MFVHILPSVMPYVVVSGMLQVGGAILLEAGLSYLGLGVQIPDPTWGNMMIAANSLDILENVPWIWAPPGFAITSTVMAVNFLGDGLRDALDPHSYST